MSTWFQDHIARLQGYVPGEQPRVSGLIKLNTNENPYPPSPRVAEAIREALDGRLRLYPDPLATTFLTAVAKLHNVPPEMVLAGNGSDDLLTIMTRAFVGAGEIAVFPNPSYILYRTLIELQGGVPVAIPFDSHWRLDPRGFAARKPKLAFLANPNSPSGTALAPDLVGEIASNVDCPLVVDEAYVTFANNDCTSLLATHRNVIILRTLSKDYALAGLRLGYLIAAPEVVEGLIKVKDSYNCDTLSLLGGVAAVEDQAHLLANRAKLLATRARLRAAVLELGYECPESQANFVWCTGGPDATSVANQLRERKLLVRLMRYPGFADGLRITVGTDEQIDCLLEALREIVQR